MGLHTKMSEVMTAIDRIPKRGRNDFHRYDYARETDVSDAIRRELSARGVAVYTSSTLIEAREWRTVKDKPTLIVFVEVSMTFVDGESGEDFTVRGVGSGDDSSDKGAYKAITGGVKYLLMKTFLIPTGDDPEASDPDGNATSKRSAPVATKASAPPPPPSNGKASAPTTEPPLVMADDKEVVAAIGLIADAAGQNKAAATKWAKARKDKVEALATTVTKAIELGVDEGVVIEALLGSDVSIVQAVKTLFNAQEILA